MIYCNAWCPGGGHFGAEYGSRALHVNQTHSKPPPTLHARPIESHRSRGVHVINSALKEGLLAPGMGAAPPRP